jgi:hypothetical protein
VRLICPKCGRPRRLRKCDGERMAYRCQPCLNKLARNRWRKEHEPKPLNSRIAETPEWYVRMLLSERNDAPRNLWPLKLVELKRVLLLLKRTALGRV